MRGAGWLGLAASSALGDLPNDLARSAWPNLVWTGSIWLPWVLVAGSIWLPWLLSDVLAGSISVPTRAPMLSFSIACLVRAFTSRLHRILMHRLYSLFILTIGT